VGWLLPHLGWPAPRFTSSPLLGQPTDRPGLAPRGPADSSSSGSSLGQLLPRLALGPTPGPPGSPAPRPARHLGPPHAWAGYGCLAPRPAGARSLPPAGGNTRPRHDRPAAGSPLRSESPTTALRPAPPSIIGRHPCRLFLQQPRPAATCTTLPAAPSPSPAGQDQGQERQGQPEPKDTPSCIPSYR
jgi:hypothetical protein